MNASEEIFRSRFLPLYPRLYAVARSITGSESDASDAVQDAMVKIWSNIRKVADVKSPLGYSLTLVRSSAIDIMRRRGHQPPPEPVDAATDSEDYTDSVDFLLRAIDTLPSNQREAIRLSALGNMATDEIALQLNISVANVRQLLSRGRRKLKEIIKHNL